MCDTEWDMDFLHRNNDYSLGYGYSKDKIVYFNCEKIIASSYELPLEYFAITSYITEKCADLNNFCNFCIKNDVYCTLYLGNTVPYFSHFSHSICSNCLDILNNLKNNYEKINTSLFVFNNVKYDKVSRDAIYVQYNENNIISHFFTYKRYIFNKKDFDFSVINIPCDPNYCHICCHEDDKSTLDICEGCRYELIYYIINSNYLNYLYINYLCFDEFNINLSIIKLFNTVILH
jgi:hypothetical protein